MSWITPAERALSACIREVWDWSDGPILVFDLTDVMFYDSSLIGALAVALQRVRATRSGRIILASPPDRLLTALERTGLLEYVEIRSGVQETVAEIMIERERQRKRRAGSGGASVEEGRDAQDFRTVLPYLR